MTLRASRRTMLLGMLATPLLLQGCGSGASADEPPSIAYGEERCARCGMIISEPRHAAALVKSGSGEPLTFDDAGEMIATVQEQGFPSGRVWAHDMTTQEWIDGTRATYVASDRVMTPMGTGVVAFGGRDEATTFAAANDGTVMDWSEIRTRWMIPTRTS